ncbi:MAG: endonuclease VII domain-containing protein [Vampirovibrionales bacterium]|nr:endonuclease VII domain-containing protein [Vampirovibrionales bacterium]
MAWKPEYQENRKRKIAEDPEYREKYLQQNKKDPEKQKAYLAEYYKNNPEKYRRTPENQAIYNATRRRKYAEDQKYREQAKRQSKEWQNANPIKRKENRLKKHGIKLSDYLDLLDKQNGGCAICGYSDMSDPKMFPVVDHCHKTGNVRGLLCMNCNQWLGKFKDNVDFLASAAMYIHYRNGLSGAT